MYFIKLTNKLSRKRSKSKVFFFGTEEEFFSDEANLKGNEIEDDEVNFLP